MSIRERLVRAIRHEPVDRTPVMTYNFHPFTDNWHQRPDGTFEGPSQYQPLMDAVLSREVGMLLKANADRHGELTERTKREVAHRGTAIVTKTTVDTPKGPIFEVFEQQPGNPGYHTKHLIESDEERERYLSLPNEPARISMDRALERYERLGDLGLVYMGYEDPMYTVARLFDFEDFCIRCSDELDAVNAMVSREFHRIGQELDAMLAQARGTEMLFYTAGTEYLTPPMFGPESFRALIMPYEPALVAKIKNAGQLSGIHCHGRVRLVLDQFMEMGIHALEPIEPPPQGDIGLAEALETVNGDLCLMGYIQDQDLYTAKPGDMARKVGEILEITDGRSGYIMTSSATPFMDDPPAAFVRNYIEYIETAAPRR